MLAKKERFSTKDLSFVKNLKSRKINTNIGFFVIYEDLDGVLGPKKGVMVSKKVFKTAPARNRYKRLFYNTIKALENLKGQSLIFHPKKIFTKEELLAELAKF